MGKIRVRVEYVKDGNLVIGSTAYVVRDHVFEVDEDVARVLKATQGYALLDPLPEDLQKQETESPAKDVEVSDSSLDDKPMDNQVVELRPFTKSRRKPK
jgi:hypothetical protein